MTLAVLYLGLAASTQTIDDKMLRTAYKPALRLDLLQPGLKRTNLNVGDKAAMPTDQVSVWAVPECGIDHASAPQICPTGKSLFHQKIEDAIDGSDVTALLRVCTSSKTSSAVMWRPL